MIFLEVENCSARCSIQDAGRIGWQRIGFPRSGALDLLALAAANTLVGNPAETAGIELYVGGITLSVLGGPVRMALAGAEFPMAIDGQAVPSHTSFVLHPGQRLSVKSARYGTCGVLAVEGGFDLPKVLGSHALHARSETGGFEGRFLLQGDRLPVCRASAPRREVRLPPLAVSNGIALRVVLGPQLDFFSKPAIETLLGTEFSVTSDCDRMAYRLSGPAMTPRRRLNFVSDGVFEGAVQVTNGGQLIVMLADHQTIGGYPKIAGLISADIRCLVNRRPGETVRFAAVSVQSAQDELRRFHARIASLNGDFSPVGAVSFDLNDRSIAAIADNAVNAVDTDTWACDLCISS